MASARVCHHCESGDDLANRRVVAVAFCILAVMRAAVSSMVPHIRSVSVLAISGPLLAAQHSRFTFSAPRHDPLRRTPTCSPDSVSRRVLLQRGRRRQSRRFATISLETRTVRQMLQMMTGPEVNARVIGYRWRTMMRSDVRVAETHVAKHCLTSPLLTWGVYEADTSTRGPFGGRLQLLTVLTSKGLCGRPI